MGADEQTEILKEMRDLLRVIAEPMIAERDKKLRAELRKAVAGGSKKAKAVLLMDGSRGRATIQQESGMDSGNLSRLITSLSATGLMVPDLKNPKLSISIPQDFFDGEEDEK